MKCGLRILEVSFEIIKFLLLKNKYVKINIVKYRKEKQAVFYETENFQIYLARRNFFIMNSRQHIKHVHYIHMCIDRPVSKN